MVISIDTDKASDNVPLSFRMKALKKLRLEAQIAEHNIRYIQQTYAKMIVN